MSEPETGHPLWLHVNKRCPQSCPYCDIAELKAELAELNAAVDIYMDEAWHHEACPSYAGNTYTQCTCGYSALQEKGE